MSWLLVCPEDFIKRDERSITIIDLNVVKDDAHHLDASFVINVVDDDANRLPINHFDYVYVGNECAEMSNATDPQFLAKLLNRVTNKGSKLFINSSSVKHLSKELKKNGFEKSKKRIGEERGIREETGKVFIKDPSHTLSDKEKMLYLQVHSPELINEVFTDFKGMKESDWEELSTIRCTTDNKKTLDGEWIGLYSPLNVYIVEEEGKRYGFTHQELYRVLIKRINPYSGNKLDAKVVKEMREIVFTGNYSVSLREGVLIINNE